MAEKGPYKPGQFAVECRCPACGGGHLFLGEGGWPTCSWVACPNPTAVSDLLIHACDPCEPVVSEDGWFVKHSLHCRIKGMGDCRVHAEMTRGSSSTD